jgi:8-oxo-dGTP pyrophosphatase MutT (NUDIX family)
MTQPLREFIDTGADAPRVGLPFKERAAVTAIVRDGVTGKYLGLRWHEIAWETFVTGGIEADQTAEEAARAEVREETGYFNLQLVCELPSYDAKFYHGPKGENRHAHFQCFLFETTAEGYRAPAAQELQKHQPVWLSEEELTVFTLPDGHRYLIEHIQANGL